MELPVSHVEYTTLALYAGLIVGAATWGILADVVGRRLSFNITLFIAGVFGIAAGGAGTFTQLAALVACIGFGVGGKYVLTRLTFKTYITDDIFSAYQLTVCRTPKHVLSSLIIVVGAIFLEVIPRTHQWLLTLLSAWWALGQLFASLVAWPLINNFSCASDADPCLKADNMGWRYSLCVYSIISSP